MGGNLGCIKARRLILDRRDTLLGTNFGRRPLKKDRGGGGSGTRSCLLMRRYRVYWLILLY